ncbi:MAG: energy transducer TonB [Mariprofundus sp.]|nr:energy transducer TonB [Mariprofundus sp.]
MALSQSRNAKSNNASLQTADLLFAILLHCLVLIIILVVAHGQKQQPHEALKRIEVMIISAQQLTKLEHHKQKKHHVKRRKVVKKKVIKAVIKKPIKLTLKPVLKIRPVLKPITKITPKPVIKKVKKATTQKKRHQPRAKAKPKVDDNFDPFAPVVSKSNIKTAPAATPHPELAALAGKQLSNSEKEHYIGLMQTAVQNHWKVPANSGQLSDPQVEMKLLANGEIASIRIIESSGSELLDASLIRAIHAAAPFKLPKEQFEFFRVNTLRFHPLQ